MSFLLPGKHQISGGCGKGLPETGRGEDRDRQGGVSADGPGHRRSGQHPDPRKVKQLVYFKHANV